MRTTWLLISIAVHGAAITALGFGVVARPSGLRPPARIEIQGRPASAPASAPDAAPDVVSEPPVADGALPMLEIVLPFDREQDFEPSDSEPLTWPSTVLQRASLDRVRMPPAASAPPTSPTEPAEQPSQVVATASPPQAYVAARELSDNEPPLYPDRERRLERQGTVVVTVAIDASGAVSEVSLQTPSRYEGFNREALRAVRRWHFEPARRDGVAVASETDIEVVFRLRDD